MGVTSADICRRISGSGSGVRSTVGINVDEVGGSKWLGGDTAILATGLTLSADPGFLVAPMFAAGPFARAVGACAYTPLIRYSNFGGGSCICVCLRRLVLASWLVPGSSSPLSSLMLTDRRTRRLPLIMFFAGKEIYF